MRLDVVTLFPGMFEGVFAESIIGRAIGKHILTVHYTNPRDFTEDKHRQVDDSPFGGGGGMLLKPEPMFRALHQLAMTDRHLSRRIIFFDPGGETFSQKKAKDLAKYERLIFVCGHYEGFDERIVANLADEALSLGDYVLTGGELAAMVVIDSVARMLPGVLGFADSAVTDSFYNDLLGFPQYTRPRNYLGLEAPEVLISGDHAKIAAWRREQSLRRTLKKRPDLLKNAILTDSDKKILTKIKNES